jgi:hypothetical protein
MGSFEQKTSTLTDFLNILVFLTFSELFFDLKRNFEFLTFLPLLEKNIYFHESCKNFEGHTQELTETSFFFKFYVKDEIFWMG